MFGIGPFELGLVAVVFVLIFGPGTVLVWWMLSRSNEDESVPAGDPALEAARERYGRGEINREEFQEIKSTLGY
ncbi:MAG: SHOCT domain-containing protein [Coriobacteriia bacterium]